MTDATDATPGPRVYLGVDGGGSKTAFALVSTDGRVLAQTTGEGSYYLAEGGLDRVERVYAEGVAAVCAAAGIAPTGVARAFFGVPAYGEIPADTAALDALPARALGHDRASAGNDMICGWAGSLAVRDGINVIAGTGSMTYGEREGRGARVGGWGEAFGDEGSGYWVAVRGLGAFSKMADGRLPRGPLADRMRAAAGLDDDLGILEVVYARWGSDRGRIASLSRAVTVAAEDGDPVASGILAEAAAELALLATATRGRLAWPEGERVPVSYSGGMFAVPAIRSGFAEALGTDYDVRAPLLSPVVGAALYAARDDGHRFDDAAIARLAGA